jgi:hypothetical protein
VFRRFRRPAFDQRALRGLGHGVGAGEFLVPVVVEEHRLRRLGGRDQRLHIGDQAREHADIRGEDPVEILDLDMRRGRQRRDVDRGMHPDIRPPPAVVDRPAEMRDGVVVGQVDGRERGVPARGLDTVVELLQPAHGARDGDHVGALRRQPFGRGRAKIRARRR